MKKFRTIFILSATHNFTPVAKYAENIQFLLEGEEKPEEISAAIERKLENFDPANCAIIPVGKVTSCLILGIKLAAKFPSQKFWVGYFVKGGNSQKDYVWKQIGAI